MRFQVPQFIDVEDKVFGPFTFRQFIYIAGGIGLSFVLLRLLPRFFAIITIIPVEVFSLSLAFFRVNNKPFIQMVESFFRYIVGARLYLWRRKDLPQNKVSSVTESYLRMDLPKLQDSKLKDLSWNLDVSKGDDGDQREK